MTDVELLVRPRHSGEFDERSSPTRRPPRHADRLGADRPSSRTASAGMICVDQAIVDRMRARLQAQTADCVMATFGISINTWFKLRDGKPIRASVAQRLLERVG